MKRKILLGGLAIALATALAYFQRLDASRGDKRRCGDFETNQVVEVGVGHNEGATGIILRVSYNEQGQCIYMVRGQRGVEMPFSEWYDASELLEVEETEE